MSRFIAIPVAQGDAFYLERQGFSVLVDGGRSRSALPSMFQLATKSDGVNVVLCTHNDADHANGILGFLEAGLGCEEVWLPGRWLDALPDVLGPFFEVVRRLTENVAETDVSSNLNGLQQGLSPIEVYAEKVYGRLTDSFKTEEGPPIAENGWPESYSQMLEGAEPWEVPPRWLGPWNLDEWLSWLHDRYRPIGPEAAQLLWSAIDAAGRIRAIAIAAFHRGIPVRWFEFDTTAPSGGIPALKPLNGREVARVRLPVGTLLERLALTVSNRESLVFWSPATEHHPGVLFTADSDLAGVCLPFQIDGAIATAPHHGSEANAKAYTVVAAASNGSPSITWVRSDGRYESRPGNTYLRLASRRFCTICRRARGSSTRKQTVRLYMRAGVWTRHRASRVCSCEFTRE
jgi:hypothetical protein